MCAERVRVCVCVFNTVRVVMCLTRHNSFNHRRLICPCSVLKDHTHSHLLSPFHSLALFCPSFLISSRFGVSMYSSAKTIHRQVCLLSFLHTIYPSLRWLSSSCHSYFPSVNHPLVWVPFFLASTSLSSSFKSNIEETVAASWWTRSQNVKQIYDRVCRDSSIRWRTRRRRWWD